MAKASRLMGYGLCNTVEELEEVRKRLRVDPANALIDSGFKAKIIGTHNERGQSGYRLLLCRINHESGGHLSGARCKVVAL